MQIKYLIIVILSIFINPVFGQHADLEIKIANYKYEIGKSSLAFDLEFTNNSRDTLILIKPFNHFFDKHYQFESNEYPQLNSAPYKVKISINKKCKDGEVERMIPNQGSEKYLQNVDLFILYPKESKKFSEVRLEIDDIVFCDKRTYFLDILYKPEVIKARLDSASDIDILISQLKKTQDEIERVTKKHNLKNISLSSQIYELTKKSNEIKEISKIDDLSTNSERIVLEQK